MSTIMKFLNRFPGSILVFAAATVWSLTALLTKAVQVNAVLLPGLRGMLAGIVLLPFFRPRELEYTPQLGILVVVFPVMNLLAVFAYRYTAAANASALYFSAPLWIFLYTCIRTKKINLHIIPPLLVIVLGIIVILLEPNVGNNQVGNLIAAATGVLNAAVCLCLGTTKMEQRINYVALFCWACFLFTCGYSFFFQPHLFREAASYELPTWGVLLAMALVQQVIPYFLFCAALQKIPVQRASILNLLEFILSPVWTFLFLHEIPTAFGMVGWCLILGGLILSELPHRKIKV